MRYKGFTLAEVLITLGIIGIVVAITIPNIISNYKKIVITNRLKKFYSIVNTAVKLSEAENGDSKDWDVPAMGKPYATANWYKRYLDKYIKSTSVTVSESKHHVWIKLIDSSAFGIRFTSATGTTFDVYFFPTQSAEFEKIGMPDYIFPYKTGKDYFIFNYNPGEGFIPYGGIPKNVNRRTLLQNCKKSSNQCTRLLMFDNWEFKKDYPYNISY